MRDNNPQILRPLSTWVIIIGFVIAGVSPIARADGDRIKLRAFDATEHELEIEPSGLVWDDDLQWAIAVSDGGQKAPGYEIFAFQPGASDLDSIRVHPLLSPEQSREFMVDDLECLTRTDDGTYYALCSLSLHKKKLKRNRFARFQGLRFRLVPGADGPKLVDLRRVSEDIRPDLREWIISSSGRDWPDESYRKPAELGGINVEGLAVGPNASDGSHILVMGLRGPILEARDHPAASLVFVKLNRDESSERLEALEWKSIDLSDFPGEKKNDKRRGIRALERIPGEADRYVMVLGHEDDSKLPLHIALWDAKSQQSQYRGQLEEGFVAEGIAVMGKKEGKLKLLLVSDSSCESMQVTIDDWE